MSDPSSVCPIQADCLVPSTLPWSSTKCNDATAPCDRKWNVSGGLSVCTKLICSLKGWWQTSENYLLMLAHSTSPLIKVRISIPYPSMCLTIFSRDDGCNDDSKRRRLGNHARRCLRGPSLSLHVLGSTRASRTGLQPGS